MTEEAELPEDESLAAEHALGGLNAMDRANAEIRMAQDFAFARLVVAWRYRLAPLAAMLKPVAPSDDLWTRIERALPANDNRALRLWRGAAIGGLGLAAASMAAVAVILLQGPLAPAAPPAMLSARLDTVQGQHLFVAAYDPQKQAVVISSLVPPGTDPGHVHQLWLIPADGKPRALGFVPVGASIRIALAPPAAGLTDAQATLAISVEVPGGSKKEGPTGPVVARGALSKI